MRRFGVVKIVMVAALLSGCAYDAREGNPLHDPAPQIWTFYDKKAGRTITVYKDGINRIRRFCAANGATRRHTGGCYVPIKALIAISRSNAAKEACDFQHELSHARGEGHSGPDSSCGPFN